MIKQLKIEDDLKGDHGEPIPTYLKILDSVLMRGIHLEREKNGLVNDYHVHNDIKEMVD